MSVTPVAIKQLFITRQYKPCIERCGLLLSTSTTLAEEICAYFYLASSYDCLARTTHDLSDEKAERLVRAREYYTNTLATTSACHRSSTPTSVLVSDSKDSPKQHLSPTTSSMTTSQGTISDSQTMIRQQQTQHDTKHRVTHDWSDMDSVSSTTVLSESLDGNISAFITQLQTHLSHLDVLEQRIAARAKRRFEDRRSLLVSLDASGLDGSAREGGAQNQSWECKIDRVRRPRFCATKYVQLADAALDELYTCTSACPER